MYTIYDVLTSGYHYKAHLFWKIKGEGIPCKVTNPPVKELHAKSQGSAGWCVKGPKTIREGLHMNQPCTLRPHGIVVVSGHNLKLGTIPRCDKQGGTKGQMICPRTASSQAQFLAHEYHGNAGDKSLTSRPISAWLPYVKSITTGVLFVKYWSSLMQFLFNVISSWSRGVHT
jgi:hypothetical protein